MIRTRLSTRANTARGVSERCLLLCVACVLLTMETTIAAEAQTSCTNLCLQQISCLNGGTTSISGTVFAPNGTDPIPNVLVYIPNAPVQAFTAGVQCLQSGQPASGSPLVSTTTAADGTFTLTNVPVGTNIPMVIQSGKWRRQFVVPSTAACANTALPNAGANQIRFPKNQAEGDIPLIAAVTGSADSLECVLRKVGLDDSEFTNPTAYGGNGRIQVYFGTDAAGAKINATTPSETVLEGNQATLNNYDLVMFACEGNAHDQSTTYLANVLNYANDGGRIFATHYSYDWLYENGNFAATAQWDPDQAGPADQTAYVNTTFPKGEQLAQWLQKVGASTVFGQIAIQNLRKDQNGVVAPTQSFLSINNPSESIQFTFNTPVGASTSNQCGRVLFNEYHVETPVGTVATGTTFPAECSTGAMTAQEKLLEYSLFDLSTFVSPDLPPTVSLGFTNNPPTFTQGDSADSIVINITNTSTTTATNPSLTIALTLPSGVTPVSLVAANPATSGWTCDLSSLSCKRTTGMDAGASDGLQLLVAVSPTASPSGESVGVTAAGGGMSASVLASDGLTIRVVPGITWPAPAPIMAGTALSALQLDATATYNGNPVPGTYTYSPASGTVLPPGSQTLKVAFTPSDNSTYAPAFASVPLEVNQGTPTITWPTPAAITYGTPLSSAQLNASAIFNGSPVPGTFAYVPPAGTVLGAGPQSLSVTFTPTDTTTYTSANGGVSLQVNPAVPTVTWAAPSAITYGTALSSVQLNAVAMFNGSPVAGTFTYTPAAGTVLAPGTQTLNAMFTPTDAKDYGPANGSVPLQVNQATPTITWSTPAAITYGTPLSSVQLNAVAMFNGSPVAGTFTYTPAAGTVLGAGTQQLGVNFTPSNTTDYMAATGSVALTVNAATPTISVVPVAPQIYGAAPLIVSATSNSPSPIVYSVVSGPAMITGNTLTVNGVGLVTFQASQVASGNYSAGAQTAQFNVSQAPNVITFNSIPNQTVGSVIPLIAKATSGLPVAFATLSPTVCSVSGSTAAVLTPGTCTIQATQPGNVDYVAASPVTQSFGVTDFSLSVSPASQTIPSGHDGVFGITLNSIAGFTGNVSLSCAGAPPNSTCVISPSVVTLNGSATLTLTVTLLPPKDVDHGTFPLTITASSGSVVHTATAVLTVK